MALEPSFAGTEPAANVNPTAVQAMQEAGIDISRNKPKKMTLNMISTAAMILSGKTLGNLMIDLQARSEKLAARSRKMLMDLFSLSLADAENLLSRAKGSVKLAIVGTQELRAICDNMPQITHTSVLDISPR